MFTRLSTVINSAVDALAPPVPLLEEFTYHWKAVTQFFINKLDHKKALEETNLIAHIDQMLQCLLEEERFDSKTSLNEDSALEARTGPCLEYFLQHKILDTMQALARADHPPGMKQQILQFFTRLLIGSRQQLLPQVRVHRPVVSLVKLCGEVAAGPTEADEMRFLVALCDKIKRKSYLVNFFCQKLVKLSPIDTIPQSNQQYMEQDQNDNPANYEFCLARSLVKLSRSEDCEVSGQSWQCLHLLSSLPEEQSIVHLVHGTDFLSSLIEKLLRLFVAIPVDIDPINFDLLEDPTGEQTNEDFAGKRQLQSFLKWLEFIDIVTRDGHAIVREEMAKLFRNRILKDTLHSRLIQDDDVEVALSTAYLALLARHLTADCLLKELSHFLLGESREPDVYRMSPYSLKTLLLNRCRRKGDEVEQSTLKLFESLIERGIEHSLHSLVLANLLSRSYYNTAEDGPESLSSSWSEEESWQNRSGVASSYVTDPACPGAPPASRTLAPPYIHKIMNCYMMLLPDELKSYASDEDLGYEQYLREAHRQFQVCTHKCSMNDWPTEATCMVAQTEDTSGSDSQPEVDRHMQEERQHAGDCDESSQCFGKANQRAFYEGVFMEMLLDKLEDILNQPYEVNLEVTSILSKLALFPHPNLHEYLLNPLVPLTPGSRNLFSVLEKVMSEVQIRAKDLPNLQRKLFLARKQLMGDTEEFEMDNSSLLKGMIVLEEFCKELAAIAFIKYNACTT